MENLPLRGQHLKSGSVTSCLLMGFSLWSSSFPPSYPVLVAEKIHSKCNSDYVPLARNFKKHLKWFLIWHTRPGLCLFFFSTLSFSKFWYIPNSIQLPEGPFQNKKCSSSVSAKPRLTFPLSNLTILPFMKTVRSFLIPALSLVSS